MVQMRNTPRLVALAFALLLAACGGAPTVIDGSSPDRFRQTMAEARAELGPGDRASFEAAVTLLKASAFAKADSRDEMEARIRRRLDGKTAEAVIADFKAKRTKAADTVIDGAFELKRRLGEGVDLIEGEPTR